MNQFISQALEHFSSDNDFDSNSQVYYNPFILTFLAGTISYSIDKNLLMFSRFTPNFVKRKYDCFDFYWYMIMFNHCVDEKQA